MSLAELDEPVRRYFEHALAPDARAGGTRLEMAGRIRLGVWLPFTATWEGDARSFRWTAAAGPRRVLRVVDQFARRHGSMDVRLGKRGPWLVHAEGKPVTRSAAGRAAAEAIWTPSCLLPETGVRWSALEDDLIAAEWDVPPERPRLELRIDERGAVRTCNVLRFHGRDGYVPCGGEVLAERTFGAMTIPSRISIGWWWGTPRYRPFFEAEVTSAAPRASTIGAEPR